MLILSVYLRVPPAEVAALRDAMRAVIAASRQEPGCRFYALAEDAVEPGLIRAFEIYDDDAALQAHANSDHFKAWRAASGRYPREERRLFDATERAP
ncbi:MAG TPA: putative quinol monooxygenase [Caulobacterales bacterium]|nr:putative quinol monooxygenase [Caulobacterales bacterium]